MLYIILINDHGNLSNIVAFLHGTVVDRFISLFSFWLQRELLQVCYCCNIFIGLYTACFTETC
jgi:hypothetical protein